MNCNSVVLDANVVLRYLLNDHEQLSERAATLIDSGQLLVIRTEIVCEVVYVLQKVYSVSREEIGGILGQFLNGEQITSNELDVLEFALSVYGSGNLDFVDCVLVALHRVHGARIASFDKMLCKRAGIRDSESANLPGTCPDSEQIWP